MRSFNLSRSKNDDALSYAFEALSFFNSVVQEVEESYKNAQLEHAKDLTDDDIRKLSRDLQDYIISISDNLKDHKNYRDPDFVKLFQFSLVALIDDLMISKDWSGKGLWSEELIELKLYGTRSAGDDFFDNCQKIITNRNLRYRELAYIYYLCLVAGFHGKYYQVSDIETLQSYKVDLYRFYDEDIKPSILADNLAYLPGSKIKKKSELLLAQRLSFFDKVYYLNFILIVSFFVISLVLWFGNKTYLMNSFTN